ncbi:cytochrome P450 [Infundibulicybe gibba]|nr:cytochrome P450 [Infundibulicybe gibba]
MLLLLLKTLALYSCAKLFGVSAALSRQDRPRQYPRSILSLYMDRQIFNSDGWDFHKSIAQTCSPIQLIFLRPGTDSAADGVEKQLYIFDPKALHHIVVKDQYIYEESAQFITANTVSLGKVSWLPLCPYFTTSRASLKVAQGPQEIDMVHWMTRAALELIGQGGLGYSFDSLQEEVATHPYSHSTKKFMYDNPTHSLVSHHPDPALTRPMTLRLFFYRSYVLPHVAHIGPPWFRRFVVNALPWRSLHQMRDIVDTMHNTSKQIFEGKKAALREGDEAVSHQVGQGNDIMSILMRANMEAADEDRLPESEVLAQMSTLTFAAMDTTSNALSRILHLLATHQDVQERLRQEIQGARTGAKDLSYDDLVSLPYLDAPPRKADRCIERTHQTPTRLHGATDYDFPRRWQGMHRIQVFAAGDEFVEYLPIPRRLTNIPEAILSLLIEKFRFEPAQGKELPGGWR